MAAKFQMTNTVRVPAETLVAKMADPEEQTAAAKHFGAVKAECKLLNDDAERPQTELYQEEQKKSGLEKSTVVSTWDLGARRCTWSRKDHTNGDRVKVSGVITIAPSGDDACIIKEEGEINIAVPIIGKQIAKKIAAAMERKHADKCAYWEQRCKG